MVLSVLPLTIPAQESSTSNLLQQVRKLTSLAPSTQRHPPKRALRNPAMRRQRPVREIRSRHPLERSAERHRRHTLWHRQPSIPSVLQTSGVPTSPVFTCVTVPQLLTEYANFTSGASNPDLWESCIGLKDVAFYISETNPIILCPQFFRYPQSNTNLLGTSICPDVSGGEFEGMGALILTTTQVYIFLHELLHFYLGDSPSPATDSNTEINLINPAFNLSATEAISNAQSYVFYAASGYPDSSCFRAIANTSCNVSGG